MIWTLADGLSDRVRHTVLRMMRKTRFAILQSKNTNVLHWKDFEPACFTDASSIRKSVRGPTLLKSNAEVVSKQAAKYSDACIDIALFDWSTMFIYGFNQAKTRREIPKDIFSMEGEKGGNTFREMLLGFLI